MSDNAIQTPINNIISFPMNRQEKTHQIVSDVDGIYVFQGHMDDGEMIEFGIHAGSIPEAVAKIECLFTATLNRILVEGE